jgi:hypothetical protein
MDRAVAAARVVDEEDIARVEILRLFDSHQ